MEYKCVGGIFALVLAIVYGQEPYQTVPYSNYDQNLVAEGHELQYSSPGAYYPISSRQGTIGLLPLGIAGAVGVGVALVGGTLAFQAANARTTISNNVQTAISNADNINNLINAQSPTLTTIAMIQSQTTTRLNSVCEALTAIGQLPPVGNDSGSQGQQISAIIDLFMMNVCTI